MIIRKIAVIPNAAKDPGLALTYKTVMELQGTGAELFMESEYSDSIKEGVNFTGPEELVRDADVIIVLGGDGSIIDAARRSYLMDIPILGINLGRVGYMATLEPEELPMLKKLFSGDYSIDERIMLSATVCGPNRSPETTPPALNDIVLTRGELSRMIDIELLCSGELAGHYRADGLIFSTPTGSTAYSMSAGGPVLDTALDAVAVTPICPHYLNSRPMVFAGSSVFEASCTLDPESRWFMTVDGRDNFALGASDRIRISKSGYSTRLINMKKNGFYDVLRRKTSEKI